MFESGANRNRAILKRRNHSEVKKHPAGCFLLLPVPFTDYTVY